MEDKIDTRQDKKIDIKHFVGKNMNGNHQQVEFQYYRQGNFFYLVQDFYSAKYYLFPVPVQDIGTASMNRKDKAITFMRWIRKAIDNGTFIEYFLSKKAK